MYTCMANALILLRIGWPVSNHEERDSRRSFMLLAIRICFVTLAFVRVMSKLS
jgi:hypothetical protein